MHIFWLKMNLYVPFNSQKMKLLVNIGEEGEKSSKYRKIGERPVQMTCKDFAYFLVKYELIRAIQLAKYENTGEYRGEEGKREVIIEK